MVGIDRGCARFNTLTALAAGNPAPFKVWPQAPFQFPGFVVHVVQQGSRSRPEQQYEAGAGTLPRPHPCTRRVLHPPESCNTLVLHLCMCSMLLLQQGPHIQPDQQFLTPPQTTPSPQTPPPTHTHSHQVPPPPNCPPRL
jgi:hypothetical protein